MTTIDIGTDFSSITEFRNGALARRHQWDGRVHESTMQPVDDERSDPLGSWWRAHLHGHVPQAAEPVDRELRTVDLFCGPGGLALGFQRACDELGYRKVSAAAVDQDAEAVQVYRANHHARRWSTDSATSLADFQVSGMGDTAEFVYEPQIVPADWQDLVGRTDVILAGPPCQGHSNLNNKTRRVDRRNEMYLTVPAVAIALKAPIVIIENVPAVLHDRQRVVQSTVALLLGAGYHVEGGVIHASKLGWPQTRQRYFLIARLDTAPVPVAQITAGLADDARSVTWAIGDLATLPFDGRTHITTDISPENQRRIDYLFDEKMHDLPPSQRPDCHKDGTTYNAVYGRLYSDKPAPTITTGFMTPGRGRYIHPTERRVLTPREAARIQGFPDTYDFHVDPTNPPAKAKLAKWIGDAVPMPLGHAAGLAALLPGPL